MTRPSQRLAGPGHLTPEASRRFIAYAVEQSRLLPMTSIHRVGPWHWRWFGLSAMDTLILSILVIWELLLIIGLLLGVR